MSRTTGDPRWVDAILDWRWTFLATRIALTSAYVLAGLTKLSDFSAAVAEMQHFGLTPGWLWASLAIVVELIGSALVISRRTVWLGAGGLGVLTAIAAYVANDFWTMQGQQRFMALNGFFEHIGLIAGLVMVAFVSAHVDRSDRRRPL